MGNSARDGVSIHAPHEGERHDGVTLAFDDGSVSIHAPHEGERLAVPKTSAQIDKVSIHAPHEGERRLFGVHTGYSMGFNPRSPRGGATITTRYTE